jgi:hypothetical protein
MTETKLLLLLIAEVTAEEGEEASEAVSSSLIVRNLMSRSIDARLTILMFLALLLVFTLLTTPYCKKSRILSCAWMSVVGLTVVWGITIGVAIASVEELLFTLEWSDSIDLGEASAA